MAARVKSFSKTFVWIIMGLLIVGLAGFGATNMGGTIRTVGKVGDQAISVDDYGRELQRQIRQFEAQTGTALPMEQARALGIDRSVLSSLVTIASLDHETSELGLSIGDENLQREILAVPSFQGIDGKFDRETYRFALNQANVSEAEFEQDLRAESARTLVQNAITAGVRTSPALADMFTDYVATRRSFTWALMGEDALETPVAEPDDAALQAYYDANPDQFTLPETKKLTYALLTPAMIMDQVELDEASVRQLYDERRDEYEQPERRLVERLVFADQEAAASAQAQLEVNGTTFEALVEDRGLSLGDVDLGDVTVEDLGEAADAIFAAQVGDVVGPLPSSLGPALFRVNGMLAARITTFKEVEGELRDELAGAAAARLIETNANGIDDLLAGGATLEELAQETDMELSTLDWTTQSDQDAAAYAGFNDAAAQATTDDYPEVKFLEDGGIFALRVDEVLPPRPEPFEQARERVAEAWSADQVQQALTARANKIVADLATNGDFTNTGLEFKVENGLTRTAFIERTPPNFMNEVFEMAIGELRVVQSENGVIIVRLEDELPPEETGELVNMRNAMQIQQDQALAQALFAAFARDAQLRARPRIDERALNAVQASFQ
ncbi:peptidyl-prolyl cis-trans isomerase [Arenibacterium sp. CAU 1754]